MSYEKYKTYYGNHNYYKEVYDDLVSYFPEYLEYNQKDIEDVDDFDWNEFYDDCFVNDSITGNASGSYTFNSAQAKEYLIGNDELLKEALSEFCTDSEDIADHFLNGDWEYFDVTIRCYILSEVIEDLKEDDDIIEMLENLCEKNKDEDEEDDEEEEDNEESEEKE